MYHIWQYTIYGKTFGGETFVVKEEMVICGRTFALANACMLILPINMAVDPLVNIYGRVNNHASFVVWGMILLKLCSLLFSIT